MASQAAAEGWACASVEIERLATAAAATVSSVSGLAADERAARAERIATHARQVEQARTTAAEVAAVEAKKKIAARTGYDPTWSDEWGDVNRMNAGVRNTLAADYAGDGPNDGFSPYGYGYGGYHRSGFGML